MKNKTKDAFKTRMVENRVQVWLGTPEESESELVLDILCVRPQPAGVS